MDPITTTTMASSSTPTSSRPASLSSAHSSPRSRSNLSLDLSSIPPFSPPTPPSNTLIITNLSSPSIFHPTNLQALRDLISSTSPIHSWAPLKSFRRIIVSFYSAEAATVVRTLLDNEPILGSRVRIYFGQETPIEPSDMHLPLPDAGKLFFISPPPSPPHGWEMKLEGAPNKQVHAEDLAEALKALRHRPDAIPASPLSDGEGEQGSEGGSRMRSRSSTLIYRPGDHGDSPLLPAIAVEDFTTEENEFSQSTQEGRTIMAHTSRPPVELMDTA